MKFRLFAVALVASIATLCVPAAASAASYIVVLKQGTFAPSLASSYNITPRYTYANAISGFSADLTTLQLADLEDDPLVDAVLPNRSFRLNAHAGPAPTHSKQPRNGSGNPDSPDCEGAYEDDCEEAPPENAPPVPDGFVQPAQPRQYVPTGISRVGGTSSPTARINGKDDARVNADIAIIDTGIDVYHPDLNLRGGVDCTTEGTFDDFNGHGTHVAGTAAALDNKYGVVGVAPGARLWAVKVFDSQGNSSDEQVVCGLDWVARYAGTIDVANMSFENEGVDDGACGLLSNDPIHLAVCRAHDRGVTLVAAAGNDSAPASGYIPAAYRQTIAVSAITDYDGKKTIGKRKVPYTCWDLGTDDAFAPYSNYGPSVDIAAPGSCIDSTYPFSIYATDTGTSMAAPHVAGAAALLLANYPNLTPKQAKRVLMDLAESGPIPGDPDNDPEGVLNVSRL